jgi:type II secretory pathway pseudopilin PulG
MQLTQAITAPRKRRVWFLPAAGAAILLLVLGGLWLLAIAVAWNFAGRGQRARTAVTLSNQIVLRNVITLYQTDKGSYPAALNQLVPNYLTTLPLDAWQRPFIYVPTPNGPTPYDLRSAGPDGLAGTADDIGP